MFKKILIIRNDNIGDLVLSTAIFREIKKKFKDSRITLICSKINQEIIEKNPDIDEILELDKSKYNLKTIWNYFKFYRIIKKNNFDVGIDLRGSLINVLFLLWLPKIKRRVGRIDYHPIIKVFLTHPIEINQKMHAIDENLEIVSQGLEINPENNKQEIAVDKNDIKSFEEYIKKNKILNYVCFCPVAGLENKQWPLENWAKLIENFDKKYQILLIGTSKEKNILEKLSGLNKKCNLILNFNLRQMSLLFKKSSLVIAQDGGPMHIAWVSGARVIEITSEENPIIASGKYFARDNSLVLISKGKNIKRITVKIVMDEIKNILNGKIKNKILRI